MIISSQLYNWELLQDIMANFFIIILNYFHANAKLEKNCNHFFYAWLDLFEVKIELIILTVPVNDA